MNKTPTLEIILQKLENARTVDEDYLLENSEIEYIISYIKSLEEKVKDE